MCASGGGTGVSFWGGVLIEGGGTLRPHSCKFSLVAVLTIRIILFVYWDDYIKLNIKQPADVRNTVFNSRQPTRPSASVVDCLGLDPEGTLEVRSRKHSSIRESYPQPNLRLNSIKT